jgi:hypothetical protein
MLTFLLNLTVSSYATILGLYSIFLCTSITIILPITVNSDEYDSFHASHLSFSAVCLLSRFHPAANIQTLLMVMQLLQITC